MHVVAIAWAAESGDRALGLAFPAQPVSPSLFSGTEEKKAEEDRLRVATMFGAEMISHDRYPLG